MISDNFIARFRRYVGNDGPPPPVQDAGLDCIDSDAEMEELESEAAAMKIVRIPEEIFIECGNLRLSLVGIRK